MQGRWWVIAGAAAALHGVNADPVQDVDLLLGEEDARRLLARLGVPDLAGGGNRWFRSAVFGCWTAPPLPVEFMAGFDYHDGRQWQHVRPVTRKVMTVDGHTLFVPAATELAALLRGFGRDKDLRRALALDRISAGHDRMDQPRPASS